MSICKESVARNPDRHTSAYQDWYVLSHLLRSLWAPSGSNKKGYTAIVKRPHAIFFTKWRGGFVPIQVTYY